MLACLSCAVAAEASAASACVASSGAQRAVLLELYTSEGCDSCPPADRRLSQIKGHAGYAGRVVPLAFHVDYWDRLGWADRFASPQYTQRQYAMAGLARSRLVYTPQFLRNGRDWRSAASPLDGIGETRPGASIVLELGAPGAGPLTIGGEVSAASAAAETYVALYENNLESQVRAGENSGKTLRHDFVVRRLIGPLVPDREGRVSLRQQIALEPAWKLADLGVVAFVQDKTTGEILQALQRHACPA
ncbi:MAG: DUF1223 domain-containing protein [Sulfuritalea sp.]|nr:DUF1223 domain-containing protein [Sulfuritalea sp.]